MWLRCRSPAFLDGFSTCLNPIMVFLMRGQVESLQLQSSLCITFITYHFLGMIPHNVILNVANGDTANPLKVSFKPLQLDFTSVIWIWHKPHPTPPQIGLYCQDYIQLAPQEPNCLDFRVSYSNGIEPRLNVTILWLHVAQETVLSI